MVLPPADWMPPMNSGGRVKGLETNVSELPRSVVVVKPTGSVVTVTWAEAKFCDATLIKSATARRRSRLEECMFGVQGILTVGQGVERKFAGVEQDFCVARLRQA